MRTSFAIFASLLLASTSMAAIEMSDEDAVYAGDGTTNGAMSQSDDGGGLQVAGDDMTNGVAGSQSMDGSMIGSQISGSSRDPMANGFQAGGGGRGMNNDDDTDGADADGIQPVAAAGAAPDGGAAADGGADGGAGGSPANGSVPEPSTLVVWTVLAGLGIGLFRTLRR